MNPELVLIGPGRVGSAITKLLHAAGYPVAAVISRDRHRAEEATRFIGCSPAAASTCLDLAGLGQIVLLALPDDQISAMAQRLREEVALAEGAVLIHFSGLHPARILKEQHPERNVISIHPLLAFADRHVAVDQLPGCPCAIEGDETQLPLARQLVEALGGRPFHLPEQTKPLYHAAACIASNYMVTLVATARNLLGSCGMAGEDAIDILLPLLKGTSRNLARFGPEFALTGPIARGDIGTIQTHLKALTDRAPELLPLYRSLGEQTLELALSGDRLVDRQAQELRELLQGEDRG